MFRLKWFQAAKGRAPVPEGKNALLSGPGHGRQTFHKQLSEMALHLLFEIYSGREVGECPFESALGASKPALEEAIKRAFLLNLLREPDLIGKISKRSSGFTINEQVRC